MSRVPRSEGLPLNRVLVTGAGGYIGRHVVASLKEVGFEVHCSGRRYCLSDATWHCADLLDSVARRNLVSAIRPSHLVHLAWCSEHGRFWNDPANLNWAAATLDLVHCFVAEGGARLLVAGTCAEYDWSVPHHTMHEIATPRRPSTLYGTAKVCTQELISAYADKVGLSHAWAVLFYSFGAFEDHRRFVPSVTNSLLAGHTTIVRSGVLRRDMLDAREVGQAIVALLQSPVVGRVNVASGTAITLKEVAEMIGAIVGNVNLLDVLDFNSPHDEPIQLVADVRRLRDEVGFRSTIQLHDALISTVEWWRSVNTARDV